MKKDGNVGKDTELKPHMIQLGRTLASTVQSPYGSPLSPDGFMAKLGLLISRPTFPRMFPLLSSLGGREPEKAEAKEGKNRRGQPVLRIEGPFSG